MAKLKINTDAAVAVANNIKIYNDELRDKLPNMDNSINALNNSWTSPHAGDFIQNYHTIRKGYGGARYTVLDNYSKFVMEQVGINYEITEENNKSLAEEFL